MTNKEMKTRLADMAGQISTIEEERREFVWTECVPSIISRMKEKGKSTLYLREAEYNKFFEPGELWGYFKGAFYAAKELRLDNDKLMLEYSMVSYSQSTYNIEPDYYNRPHYYNDGNEDGMVAEVDREISDAILVGIINKLLDDEIYKIGFHGRVEDDLMLNYTIDSDEFNIEGFTYFPAKDIRFVWNMERLDKTVTHLPFDIYVNTCRETDHPLALFIPDEYHDPLRYFAVVIYDSGCVGFPDDKLLRFMHHIEPRDLSNVLRFASHYKDMLIQLSKSEGEISVWKLNSDAFLLNKTPIDKSYLLKEEELSLIHI